MTRLEKRRAIHRAIRRSPIEVMIHRYLLAEMHRALRPDYDPIAPSLLFEAVPSWLFDTPPRPAIEPEAA